MGLFCLGVAIGVLAGWILCAVVCHMVDGRRE